MVDYCVYCCDLRPCVVGVVRGKGKVNPLDMIGQDFGWLRVIEKGPTGGGSVYWYLRCRCGTVIMKEGREIRSGRLYSCGCASMPVDHKRPPMYQKGTLNYFIYKYQPKTTEGL